MVRILVVDDHPVTREGIRLAVCARHDPCQIDICDSIAAAREHLRNRSRYHLILLDYRLPDTKGLTGLFQLHPVAHGAPIALLTASTGLRLASIAQAAGAVGYLSKALSLSEIADGIDLLLAGGTLFPTHAVADPAIVDLRDRITSLSPAQLQVLVAVRHGALNKQIAHDLDLTEATIKAHMTAIFRKLGVNSRAEVIEAVQPLFGDID